MTDAVKPLPCCPFCGREPHQTIDRADEHSEWYSCQNHECPIYAVGMTEEQWNRRTPPAGWKPIETAPKDGTRILMWDTEFTEWKIVQWDIGEPSILCGDEKYWVTDSEGPNPDNHIVENPKYWMPLPAAPENDDE